MLSALVTCYLMEVFDLLISKAGTNDCFKSTFLK